MDQGLPPIGPGPGAKHLWICLSYGEGTCPRKWIEALARQLPRRPMVRQISVFRRLPGQDLLDLGPVHFGDEWNAADVSSLVSEAGQIISRNMLQ